MTQPTIPEEELNQKIHKIIMDFRDVVQHETRQTNITAIKNAHELAATQIRSLLSTQRLHVLEEVDAAGSRNVYTLDEVRERNKHLDSRTQQSALDKSQGIIETNDKWREAIARLKEKEQS